MEDVALGAPATRFSPRAPPEWENLQVLTTFSANVALVLFHTKSEALC